MPRRSPFLHSLRRTGALLAPWLFLPLLAAPLAFGAGKELTGDDLLAAPPRAQLTYVAGWLDGYLQALDGVNDRAQLKQWRACLQGRGMEEMRVRVVFYYSRHPEVRGLRLQLTMLDALLEACERPPRFSP